MDLTRILVISFTLSAIGFLIWIELNSRRNQRALKESSSDETAQKEQRKNQQ